MNEPFSSFEQWLRQTISKLDQELDQLAQIDERLRSHLTYSTHSPDSPERDTINQLLSEVRHKAQTLHFYRKLNFFILDPKCSMFHPIGGSGMTQWQKKVVSGSAPDPLANYQGVPIFGQQREMTHYVGRVIVELWEPESGLDDSYSFAFSIDAANEDQKTLLKRVAAALPERVKRDLNKLFP